MSEVEELKRDEELFKEAIKISEEGIGVSTSLLQRRLSIGYGRAVKLLERLEEDGYDISKRIEGDISIAGLKMIPFFEENTSNVKDPTEQYRQIYDRVYKLCMFFKKNIFNDDLPQFVLTLNPSSSRSETYGWCWKDIWSLETIKQEFCEIAICSQYLSRPFEEVASTVLHELVHLYANYKGIKDTSSNGKYHNRTYKELGEKFGLIVKNTGGYLGWTDTTLSESTKTLLNDFQDRDINFLCDTRNTCKKTTVKKPQNPKKTFVCPSCDQRISSKIDLNIICGKCNVKFKIEDDYDI